MGLDMFLYNSDHEEVMYWRKANQINRWFEEKIFGEEVANCTDYEVDIFDLQELVIDATEVLSLLDKAEKIYDEEYPEYYVFNGYNEEVLSIMPPGEGFFFGSYEIDRWYYEKLETTVKEIQNLIDISPASTIFYYHIWY